MPKKKKKKKSAAKRKKIDRTKQAPYDYHKPVLLEKSIDSLITDKSGIYVDGTLGGGGHAAAILQRLSSGGTLIAFDKDEESISRCRTLFRGELSKGDDSRLKIVNQSFTGVCSIEWIQGKASGFLLDLGVSSRQLDSAEKGFTYREDSTLDMRFGNHGKTAAEILNSAPEEELTKIFRRCGEEPFSRPIARRIAEIRRAFPFETTFQLRRVVEEIVPPKMKYNSLSRVFQALRIAVNDELTELSYTLENFIPMLAKGGRIVVISYHSLEDRIVKNIFRDYSKHGKDEETAILKILTKKPITADETEIRENPRARSAKMRASEKI